MHTWLEISKTSLLNNVEVFKKISAGSDFMPVIKSNAYGHGMREVAEILVSQDDIKWIGVNSLHEARELRSFGVKKEILVVGPSFESDFEELRSLNVKFIMGHFELLDPWLKLEDPPVCHIKIDTGMSRQGFVVKEAEKAAKKIKESKHGFSKIEALATHFANVEDVLEHDYANLQLKEFDEALKIFKHHGFSGITHAASSASTLLLAESRFDLVRIGISLYGFWPSKATRLSYLGKNSEVAELKPVMSWKSKVAQIKSVEAGKHVGYGCAYKAQSNLEVAIIPVGYYEGFPRLASMKQSYVLIGGQRCLVLGRICMNMMMVDVTNLSKQNKIKVGDEVVLIGKSGEETLDAETVADWADTIHYELVTRINCELERRVVD